MNLLPTLHYTTLIDSMHPAEHLTQTTFVLSLDHVHLQLIYPVEQQNTSFSLSSRMYVSCIEVSNHDLYTFTKQQHFVKITTFICS